MKAPIYFFLFFSYTINAQFIAGKILEANSKIPLPYVNIGVLNQGIGTVSDQNGEFYLELNPATINDTLRFSMVGFTRKDFIVKDYLTQEKTEQIILLEESVTSLEEVVLVRKKDKKYKQKILGNKTESKFITGGFTSNNLGNEIGFITRIRKSPTFVESFNISIAKNTYGPVKFRLNFYDLKDGLPNKNILEEMIIIETDIKTGIVSVDLTPYDIVVEDDFVVAIEWVEDLGIGNLLFSAGFFGSNLFARVASQGQWERIGVAAIGMNVGVTY
tara:strand:+ start:3343 stop:4164 length:822 start_codon:yes stop_codon:yes gene_type:complete